MAILKSIFGDSDSREVKRIMKTVGVIEALEPEIKKLSDGQLKAKTAEFKERLQKGETLDDILPESFAVVREAAIRTIGQRHFTVQLVGGVVLHQGRIAEMKTGEGKTLVATLPVYLNALAGKGVHMVTVNDYLARRDSEWMGKIYKFLGLSVGLVVPGMTSEEKRKSYACDVIFGTNNEYGFDYLRDNMVIHKSHIVQRELSFAIIDEIDSILIDEARTPLIISGQGDKSTEMYTKAHQFVRRLKDETDYTKDEKLHTVNLTDEGVQKAESFFAVENLGDIENTELSHHINQALKANTLMHRDKDYIVKDGQVIIVDEFTGRLMVGRRYSNGLHQAIEAKENVQVQHESKTLATITFQNYFRMYKKLSGMTATAKTEEEEFRGIYGLDVVTIPTNKPMIREDYNDVIMRTVNGKFNAVVEEIKRCNQTGQPVLVGTVSVEKSEHLSAMLKRQGIRHTVLNAKFHEMEAEIVAQAGKKGMVTIATNMAGRGTDIMLGGNPDFMARKTLLGDGADKDMLETAIGFSETVDNDVMLLRQKYNQLFKEYKKETDREHNEVVALGGLHIIGTERHESRRIDNQLRGRAGRQGDPGSSRFFISLEDDLMRLFGGERMDAMMQRLGMDEDMPLEYGLLSKQIENAQKRVESRNYGTRKHVLQYDDVMNKQREVIYSQRRSVLEGKDLRQSIIEMIGSLVRDAVNPYTAIGEHPEEWDINGLLDYFEHIFLPKGFIKLSEDQIYDLTRDGLIKLIEDAAVRLYEAREKQIAEAGFDMRELERVILLRVVDQKWMDHIDNMDQLRQGVGLRAYGQRDPIIEYRIEGFDMFDQMVHAIREETLTLLYRANIQKTPQPRRVAQETQAGRPAQEKQKTGSGQKVGRNDPCPCGSGKKYKNCCGK